MATVRDGRPSGPLEIRSLGPGLWGERVSIDPVGGDVGFLFRRSQRCSEMQIAPLAPSPPVTNDQGGLPKETQFTRGGDVAEVALLGQQQPDGAGEDLPTPAPDPGRLWRCPAMRQLGVLCLVQAGGLVCVRACRVRFTLFPQPS